MQQQQMFSPQFNGQQPGNPWAAGGQPQQGPYGGQPQQGPYGGPPTGFPNARMVLPDTQMRMFGNTRQNMQAYLNWAEDDLESPKLD
jgi:hypothetical protein